MSRTTLLSTTLASAIVAACYMQSAAPPKAEPLDTATTYVAKVKNVLIGMPPTDAEVQAVQNDPTQLGNLIDTWMTDPAFKADYQQKQLRFFQLAFQQTQVSITDFADQAFPNQADVNQYTTPLLLQNATESFARTMVELVAEGRPLTDATTTTRFMMTPALMELYAFFDGWEVDDAGKVNDRFRTENPKGTIYVGTASGPIAITDSLDPNSPNYMHWYDPDVTKVGAMVPGCNQDPIAYPAVGMALHYILQGALLTRKSPVNGNLCGQYGGSAMAPQLTGTDYSDWKMVTIRPPNPGEPLTQFYDLPTLRTATELVLKMPRVGFFTTPAFFANWQTNTSNQMRVTMNQTLIVATGAMVDGKDTTFPTSTPGMDATHSSQVACVQCHQTLDPTRSILSSTYSWNYHDQVDNGYSQQKGLFAFQGVIQPVSTVMDLGNVLAQHPRFAQAWVQKLCYYANSEECETTDPEFQRVVGVFQSSGYSWNALVRELLSSPLVTHATPTQTLNDHGGEVIAVTRRDHLCAALNNRLNLVDVCGLNAMSTKAMQTTIPEIVSGLPSDGYGRGAVAPVLPNQPTLFYRAGTENICEAVSQIVIDSAPTPAQPNVKPWSSGQPDAAIADFVSVVMGLTASDPRSGPAQSLLKDHFTQATQQGAKPSDALKSTFIVACLAPSFISIGL